ncbi:MAG: DUF4384 domain-containing protein [Bradyrhizobium sp.]|uniref:DUF4384 domain-containing protein n=1 Tax=Bradyrhizobium sp. TaxID=376 RepID=UPI003D0DC006
MKIKNAVVALGLVLIASGPAWAGDDVATQDLTVQQIKAVKAGPSRQSSIQLMAGVDRKDAIYAMGEKVKINLKVNENAYVAVYNVGPKGKVTQLFPNRFQKDNLIKAGHETLVPSAGSGAEIKVSGSTGAELIKVIASSKPLKVVPESILAGDDVFMSVQGGVDAFVQNLEVVAKAPPADKVSIVNLAIKTVGAR